MGLSDLPALNACLNASSAVLLASGWVSIKRGRREAHHACMLGAVGCSSLFLASYLAYHFQVGSVRFHGEGPLRTFYFAVLISHTVLAAAIVPLVIATLLPALRQRFERHRRLARVTLPLWGYVSVTGVAIYWMLYRL